MHEFNACFNGMEDIMKFDLTTTTAGFGAVVIISTMGLFLNGASALDLGEFSSIDQEIITKEAPKAGGIALIKEDTVFVNKQRGPILTAVSSSSSKSEGTYYDYNNIAPAAGPSTSARIDGDLSGRPVPPVAPRGMGGPNDSATDPTDPYAAVQARLNSAGSAQEPQPNSAHALAEIKAGVTPLTPAAPLVNTIPAVKSASASKTVTDESIQDLTDIAPAAGFND